MNFSITPVGPFPPSNDEGFPQFIQWRDEGVDLGGPDADTVDFTGEGVTATRGTGETANVITVEILAPPSLSLQFQDHGADLGLPDATTVNIEGELHATRDGDTITINAQLVWRDVPGDTEIDFGDAGNGLSMSGTSGEQIVTVPGDTGDPEIDLPEGTAILIYQEGSASVSVVPVSGVLINVRSPLDALLAGQFATATLLKRRANEWILCGDLSA